MNLTRSERAILDVLEAHRDQVVGAAVIATEALGYPMAIGEHDRTLSRAHVSNLRRKGIPVRTAQGRGYYLGELPPPPRTYEAWCEWCHARFVEPAARAPRYRYCREHRAKRFRQRVSDIRCGRRAS